MISVARTLIESYCRETGATLPDLQALEALLTADSPFREKWKNFDTWIAAYPQIKELEDFLFDILIASFLTSAGESLSEDYFEGEEWAQIEEDAADKGTEWLNLFVYFEDCGMNEFKPELEDYLENFLLVEEDEFQDEHEMYEALILLQSVVGASPETVLQTIRKQEEEDASELDELLAVLLFFFGEIKKPVKGMKPLEVALLDATWEAEKHFIKA